MRKVLSESLLTTKAEKSAAIVTSRSTVDVVLALFAFLAKENAFEGVVLCVDRPHSFYKELLESNGIDSSKVTFINVGFKETGDNVVNIGENASDLTFMKIEAVRTAQKIRIARPNAKIFMLNDAVTTLLLYNDEKIVGQFLHDINNKLRELNVYALTILEPGERIGTIVKKLADVSVELD